MFSYLRKAGILGINRRVGEFILPYNPRKHFPKVDDKILTYIMAKQYKIAQPDIYFTVSTAGQLKTIQRRLEKLESFVIKPSRGAMGNGILLINSVTKNEGADSDHELVFDTSRGDMNLKDVKYHISDILSGMYSLSGQPDQVIIQEKLSIHPTLGEYAYKGIPDIRVIVFKGYPVMAMIRLPTKSSRGRANLHQGAVGCGINLKTGQITGAVCQDKWITNHPDTGHILEDLVIPFWDEVLELSSRCYEITSMGYIGVDLVLDENAGPLLLEINARPGLSIQIANKAGLKPRLDYIKLLSEEIPIPEKIKLIKQGVLF
ncbi:MAG: alpha-L-glutamate ligase-like protein [Halobacteriovoraceae bacterium]|nr:alpha-L-glutamate ligase-like protein [Halobacteriovoraceae bacterium]MBC99313.1 alpha-L-glutamate ligase-like protein [Halobacteriovoraceae bacterium]|tara:strand:+ start:41891 stop:42844 length:954 start_codon:yes stop_codon:yes gene_type:complete